MPDKPIKHLDPQTLEALATGELEGHDLGSNFLLHLIALCPICSEAMVRWTEGGAPAARTAHPPSPPEDPSLTKRQLRSLLAKPEDGRLEVIRRAREWYRSPEVARALLEKSREAMPEEPSEAEHFASLSRAVASRSPAAGARGLESLAAMHEANALRVKGRLRDAEHLARHARFLAAQAEIQDFLVLSELDWYEGALRKDQDRFDEAERLLVRAIAQYRLARRPLPLAGCLITLGELHRTAGEPEKAVEAAREVLAIIDPISEPRLYLCARHNLALYLSDIGRSEEASAVLEDARGLYDAFPDQWTRLRLRWLEGRISRGLGRYAEAREAFAEVTLGYLKLGVGYDAALATIDAADACLLEGRQKEFAALGKLLEPVLRSEDLHQEARLAVALFQKALVSHMVTEALTAHVRTYLTEARSNPSLRYEPI